MLGNKLSLPLPVIGLVSRYLTNYLIGRRPFFERITPLLVADLYPLKEGNPKS